jgi:hypothetical protein
MFWDIIIQNLNINILDRDCDVTDSRKGDPAFLLGALPLGIRNGKPELRADPLGSGSCVWLK